MPSNEKQVPVHYLAVPGTLSDEIDTSGGIVAEMCTECFALVPTEKVHDHISRHGQENQRPVAGRPDNTLPQEPGTPDQGLPPEDQPPPEVSGGAPPTAGTQPM